MISKQHLSISPKSSKPYYVQIEKKLMGLISTKVIQPGQKIPSEKDIGEMCGVSRVTVRQAINNLEKNGLVYRLHGKGTFVGSGVVIPKVKKHIQNIIIIFLPQVSSRLHPYTIQLIHGIERQANIFDFSVSITSDLNTVDRDNTSLGVILTSRIPLEDIKKLQKKNIPFVLTNEHSETYKQEFPSVQMDSREAGYRQTQHLIELGHRRIAIFTGILNGHLRGEANRKRVEGYRLALEQSGIDFDEHLIEECDYELERTIAITRDLLSSEKPPTAILAADDIGAGIIMNTLREENIRVPEDISVIGLGNFESSVATFPPLTTYQIPAAYIGEKAFSLLYKIIKHEDITLPIHVYGTLVIRKSCATKISNKAK